MKSLFSQLISIIPRRFRLRHRIRLAARYLSGEGLEIGALHSPLILPPGCSAKYVDIATREQNIKRFPELNPSHIVDTDYVTDGFSLRGVPSGAFDFLIANHVLEHSPDPIGVLARWVDVLRPSGKLFLSVPLASRCFDRGREISTYEHLLRDYINYREGRIDEINQCNREHYREWLTISEPNILGKRLKNIDDLEQRIDELVKKNTEIHFHTFSERSAESVFNRICSDLLPATRILEIHSARNEVVVLLQKAGQ